MYAPKFRSWMSDWDRFEESLEHRLQQKGDEILAEARRQLEAATPKQPPPAPVNPYWNMLADPQMGSWAAYQIGAMQQSQFGDPLAQLLGLEPGKLPGNPLGFFPGP